MICFRKYDSCANNIGDVWDTRAMNDAVFEASKSCVLVGTAANAYRSWAATAPPLHRATVPVRKKVAPR